MTGRFYFNAFAQIKLHFNVRHIVDRLVLLHKMWYNYRI